jgi:translocation and assembly module TamB
MSPRLRRLIVAAIAMPAAALTAVALLYLPPGERLAARLLAEAASEPGRRVELDGFELHWPFVVSAARLTVADAAGVWLTVRRPYLEWHPLGLTRRLLDFDRLAAERVVLDRLPSGTAGGGAAFDRFPVAVRLDSLAIPLALGPSVAGEPLDILISGSAAVLGGGGRVDLIAREEGGVVARLAGTAGRDFLDLRWHLALPSLARWQGVAGVPLAGELLADGVVAGRLPRPVLTVTAEVGEGGAGDLHWRTASVGLRAVPDGARWQVALQGIVRHPVAAGVALPLAEVTAAGEVETVTGRLLLSDARLRGGGASLSLRGTAEEWGRRANVTAEADLPRLEVLRPGLRGRAHAHAHLAGNVAALNVQGVLRLRVHDLATGGAALDTLLGPSPRGVARLALTPDGVRLGAARIDAGRGRLWLAGRVGRRIALWAEADLPDIGAVAPAAAGPVQVHGRLVGPLDDLAVWGVAESSRLTVAGLPPVGAVVAFALPEAWVELAGAGGARLAGPLRLTGQGVSGRLDGVFPDLATWPGGDGVVGRAAVSADLTEEVIRLTADGDGLVLGGVAIDAMAAAGTVRLGWERATVERLRLALAGEEVRLAVPADVAWGGGVVRLDPARLAVGSGSAVLQGRFAVGRLDGEARLERLPLGLVEAVTPGLGAVGRVSGSVRLNGSVVVVDLQGERVGVAASADAGLGHFAVSLAGRWADGRAEAVVNARDGERLELRAEGTAPLPGDGPVAGRVTVRGELGRLANLVSGLAGPRLAGHVLSGRLEGEADLGGTLSAPRLSGSALVRGGRYENLDQGTVITGIEGTATMAGDRIRMQMQGGDGGDGRLRLMGEGRLDDASYHAEATLSAMRVVRRDEADATLSGRLILDGRDTAARLSGDLAVETAEFDLGQRQGSGVVALEVEEVNARHPAGSAGPEPEVAEAEIALGLDVAVRRAFVRGRGLESEWQGHLEVMGTLVQPQVTGRLAAERGEYDLLGRSFRLTRDSMVTFTGSVPVDPALAVVAEARAKDITARVMLGGTARHPEIDFTSEPPLPRDEVLARVLFGQGTGGLSVLQQIQLGRLAVGRLAGGEANGFDPIGTLRSALGLDVLGVGTTENGGGPAVSAGKYIGPDTFVKVEQGAAGLGKVTVEQDLGRGFSVESSLGQQTGSAVGLNWRKDY